ncbi:GNAT family N-acetyltransferase [Planctomonas deserti]|uniref:GNAT family N-acetyltransferase n=1 Tax=Planctomonas deserti TaxID=2144185 RepID=UPI000D3D59AA|nr:GNAT family N-acetyltransferase [Planctomonas deserti]
MSTVRFRPLGEVGLRAVLDGDLDAAARSACLPALPPFLLAEDWLWRIRLDQIARRPGDEQWVAWLAVRNGEVIGHTGFHGPPDEAGEVEISYTVLPEFRGRGLAGELLDALLEWCAARDDVRSVRASISPDNTASLALVRRRGFERVGEQIDEEDGLEWIFRRPA